MSVLDGVERDLERLPDALRYGSLAQMARHLAARVDGGDNSLTSESMAAKSLESLMAEVRDLAPPEEKRDVVVTARERHAARRRGAATAHQPRP